MIAQESSQPSCKKRKSAGESIYGEDAQGDIDVDTDGHTFCDFQFSPHVSIVDM